MDLEPISPARAVELYLKQRKSEAYATLNSHRSRLRHFVEWCEKERIMNLNGLSGRDLYEFRVWRQEDGELAKASLKAQLTTLRVFVKWLEAIEGVEPDLHTKILLPSLSDDEATRNAMLDAKRATVILDHLRKYEYASMRHVIVALAWTSAMRRGALHALDVPDYHSDEQFVEVVHRPETPLKNRRAVSGSSPSTPHCASSWTTGWMTAVPTWSTTRDGNRSWRLHRGESTRAPSGTQSIVSPGPAGPPTSAHTTG